MSASYPVSLLYHVQRFWKTEKADKMTYLEKYRKNIYNRDAEVYNEEVDKKHQVSFSRHPVKRACSDKIDNGGTDHAGNKRRLFQCFR